MLIRRKDLVHRAKLDNDLFFNNFCHILPEKQMLEGQQRVFEAQ